MTWRVDVRCAGSGGQGLGLAAVVLAEVGLAAGCEVAFTQEYGPEARGGATRADVVMSDAGIANPQLGVPGILLALDEKAWGKFAVGVPAVMAALAGRTAMAVVDSDRVAVDAGTPSVLALPFEAVARDELRAKVVANMLAVGAVARLIGRFPVELVERAVAKRSPAAFLDLNGLALHRGWAMMEELLAGSASSAAGVGEEVGSGAVAARA